MSALSELLHTLMPMAEAIVAAKGKLDHVDDLDREIQDLMATEASVSARVAEANAVIDEAKRTTDSALAQIAAANKAVADADARAAAIVEAAKAKAEREASLVRARVEKDLANVNRSVDLATVKLNRLQTDIDARIAERASITADIQALKAKLA